MGRKVRKMTLEEATAVQCKRGSRTLRCHQCPRWNRGFCTILGKPNVALHPCCAYGKVLIRAARMKSRRKNGGRS